MRKKPKYITEYYVLKTIAIITMVLFYIQVFVLTLLFIILFITIGFVYIVCGGYGCDGPGGCGFSTDSALFVVLMIWIVEITVMEAISVFCFKKASDNKIPKNPEDEENQE